MLPVDRTAFNHAIIRLFDIAESKSKYILDESRVHAMNTLNTAFFDTRLSAVLGPYIERGFLLSISMFVSTKLVPFLSAYLVCPPLTLLFLRSPKLDLSKRRHDLLRHSRQSSFREHEGKPSAEQCFAPAATWARRLFWSVPRFASSPAQGIRILESEPLG